MTKQTKEETVKDTVVYSQPDMMFANDWKDFNKPGNDEQLENYIIDELKRLIKEKKPLISSILLCESSLPKSIAFLLINGDAQNGIPPHSLFSKYANNIKLQLEPTVTPPAHDYNGCPLPEGKRGKVLAAKGGLRAEYDHRAIGTGARAEETRGKHYTGAKLREYGAKARRIYGFEFAPYVNVEIGFNEPTSVSFTEAVNILSRYGFGVAKNDKLWFVVEVQ